MSPSSTAARLAVVFSVLALAVGCAPSEKAEAQADAEPPSLRPDRVLPFLAERSGEVSRIAQPTRTVIRPDAAEEPPDMPGVPLDELADAGGESSMIVVWALGEKPSGGFGIDITDVLLFDRTLIVRGRLRTPSADEMVTEALTYPFHAVAVPAVEFDEVFWHAIRPFDRLYGEGMPPMDDGVPSR